MRAKEQVIFDIKADKFRYLRSGENKIKNRVNIDTLNKRLNRVKKLNIYNNAKMIVFSVFIILSFALVSLNF
tara:strand:+ start:127 stop:342 length:216 start_codon:yes stop_codon:yes gene_type:complete